MDLGPSSLWQARCFRSAFEPDRRDWDSTGEECMWTRLRVASVTVVGALAIGSALGLSADKHQGAEGKAPTRLVAMPSAQAHVSSSSKSTAYVSAAYGKLPLAFEPNVGQAKSDAKFLAHGDGYALLLNADSAV